MPRASPRPDRPGHLGEQLEGLLGGAEVGEVQQRVRREHADRGHVREVVALRDHLRADEALHGPGPHRVDDRVRPAAPARGVAVEHRARHAREPLGEALGHALGAGADGFEDAAAALRTAQRSRRALAAVVADEPPALLVHRARDAAPAAAEVLAALAAQEERREPAPGLQEDRLLAAREHLLESLEQRAGEERHSLLVGPGGLPPEVHDRDFRQRAPRDALGQDEALEPARLRGVPRLHGRGRRAEDERRSVLLRAQRDHVAGVVARRLALLVRGVLLLVDDEQARVRDRSEGGGARTDHRPRLAAAHAVPGVGALAVRERRVEHGGERAELPRQLAREDGRERDLRDEPDRAPSRVEREPDRAQVHLGLAAAGHALEQRREEAAFANRGGDAVDRRRLRRRRRVRRPALRARAPGSPRRSCSNRRQQPELGQTLQHRGAGAGRLADLRGGRGPAERVEVLEDVAAPAAPPGAGVAVLPRGNLGLVGELDAPAPSPGPSRPGARSPAPRASAARPAGPRPRPGARPPGASPPPRAAPGSRARPDRPTRSRRARRAP